MASPFVGKDGSRHTNHDSMKRADARFGSKQPAKPAPKSMADGTGDSYDEGAEDGSQDGAQAQDGAAMAQEHGPAVQIAIEHDHEGGRHTVHAAHPDGHEHDSEHASAGEAHKFAADLSDSGMSE